MGLEGKNLACIKGEKILFRNLNFSLSKGQLAWIKGPNGAGKSSLAKIAAGLCLPQKGMIGWQGQNIQQQIEGFRASMSYLGHTDGLRLLLSPRENLQYHAALSDILPDPSAIDTYLTQFKLSAVAELACQQLSQGQRRKVALCALCIRQRPLWILDEPFTALDHASSVILQAIFKQYLAAGGVILLVSHTPLTAVTPTVVIDLTTKAELC